MFKLSGAAGRSPFIMMPPKCAGVADGTPLEDVYFLRDDMAAMSWAVENQLQGPLDAPVDATQLAFEFDAAYPQPTLPAPTPGRPAVLRHRRVNPQRGRRGDPLLPPGPVDRRIHPHLARPPQPARSRARVVGPGVCPGAAAPARPAIAPRRLRGGPGELDPPD